jgi:hypothetical protein
VRIIFAFTPLMVSLLCATLGGVYITGGLFHGPAIWIRINPNEERRPRHVSKFAGTTGILQ